MSLLPFEDVVERASSLFGHHPDGDRRDQLEQHYNADPQLFTTRLDDVERLYREGGVRSGWGLLLSKLRDPGRAAHTTTATVDAAGYRAQQLGIAEIFVRNAGHQYDLDDCLDELFGTHTPPRGRLRAWPELKPQLRALWHAEQPRTEALLAEQAEAARSHRENRRITDNPQLQDQALRAHLDRVLAAAAGDRQNAGSRARLQAGAASPASDDSHQAILDSLNDDTPLAA